MGLLEFLVYALATWRLSSLFVSERGPFDVFQRIREAVGIEHDEDGKISVTPETLLAGILGCVWCLSVWVGFALTISVYYVPLVSFWLMLPFALSGAAIVIERVVRA